MNKTKKIISIIMLIVILGISFITTNTYAADVKPGGYEVGDINGDGKINVTDVVILRAHLLKSKVLTETLKLARADFDFDGKVNNRDFNLLNKYVKGTLKVGDLNGDGKINVTDISILAHRVNVDKNHIYQSRMKKFADIDGNGKINSDDVTLLGLRVKGIVAYFPAETKKGDINLDGRVDLTDFAMLRTYVMAIKGFRYEFSRVQADLNGDGAINVTDLMSLRKKIML